MKKNKFFVLLLTSSLVLSSFSVYAEENTEETTESTTEISTEFTTEDLNSPYHAGTNTTMTLSEFKDMVDVNSESFEKLGNDEVYKMMKNSLMNGEDIALTEAFSMSTGLEIPDNMMYDLSDCGMDGTIDTTSINLQYANVMAQMDKDFNTSLDNLSSNSVTATELFNNTYGNLANELKVSKAELPEGFSFSELAVQNSTSFANAYGNAINSSEFQNIRNTVSIRDMFSEADKGVTRYGLASLSDLDLLTKDYELGIEQKYIAHKNTEWGKVQSQGNKWNGVIGQVSSEKHSEIQADIDTASDKYNEAESSIEQGLVDRPVGKYLDSLGFDKAIRTFDNVTSGLKDDIENSIKNLTTPQTIKQKIKKPSKKTYDVVYEKLKAI